MATTLPLAMLARCSGKRIIPDHSVGKWWHRSRFSLHLPKSCTGECVTAALYYSFRFLHLNVIARVDNIGLHALVKALLVLPCVKSDMPGARRGRQRLAQHDVLSSGYAA